MLKIAHIQKRPRAIACEVSIHENLILKKFQSEKKWEKDWRRRKILKLPIEPWSDCENYKNDKTMKLKWNVKFNSQKTVSWYPEKNNGFKL